MEEIDNLLANQILELRRGTIVLAVLTYLRSPTYGYKLLQTLDQAGITVDAGTLYPLLRRLEKQGALESSWSTGERHSRKFYVLSQQGTQLYQRLVREWSQTNEKLNAIIERERRYE